MFPVWLFRSRALCAIMYFLHDGRQEKSHGDTEFVLRHVMCKYLLTSEEELLHVLQKASHLQFPSISVRIGAEMFASLTVLCTFLTFGKLVARLQ